MAFDFHSAKRGIILANPHRGYCTHFPENTMPAFQAVLDNGLHTIEIDTAMTADGQFVVIHDPTINRTSNGTGYVEQMTLAEIKQYDFGGYFGEAFKNTPIPELRDVLLWAVENGVGLVLELKQRRNHARCAEVLADLLRETNAVDNVILLGFDHVLINRVKTLLPQTKIQVVTLARYQNQLQAVLGSNADSVCCEYHYVTKEDLIAYKNAGLTTRLFLHSAKPGEIMSTTQRYNEKYGYDAESEILEWLREGLIDMLSHDDIGYLKEMVEKAGKVAY